MSAAAELRPAITSAQVLPYRRHHAKPWVFAALVTVGMLSAAAYQFVGERPRGNTRPVAAAMADVAAGEIHLTEAEMHALRIEPVLERVFRPERLIEGRIAYDEEGVTPVFSPYGRREFCAWWRIRATPYARAIRSSRSRASTCCGRKASCSHAPSGGEGASGARLHSLERGAAARPAQGSRCLPARPRTGRDRWHHRRSRAAYR